MGPARRIVYLVWSLLAGITARPEPISTLFRVFDVAHRPPTGLRHGPPPPQYMLDLYSTIADSSGVTRTPNPYYASVVRSFPDKDSSHHLKFHFNISSESVSTKEQLLEAEFHVYKLKPKQKALARLPDAKSHLLEVRVFQIMPKDGKETKRLLDVRRVSTHSVGWEVFYIKPAVIDWLQDPSKNLGLQITVKNLLGHPAEEGLFRVAKRHQHHINKQPILVLFCTDRRKASTYPKLDFHTYGYPELSYFGVSDTRTLGFKKMMKTYDGRYKNITASRSKKRRSPASKKDSHKVKSTEENDGCRRHELYVDFEKIGWASWIISPKGYNAFFCKGVCTFPLGQNQWPTNHATVQSIVNEMNLTPGVGKPCCVPNRLYSISLLYFDDQENVILKQYEDMVAASCGCQ